MGVNLLKPFFYLRNATNSPKYYWTRVSKALVINRQKVILGVNYSLNQLTPWPANWLAKRWPDLFAKCAISVCQGLHSQPKELQASHVKKRGVIIDTMPGHLKILLCVGWVIEQQQHYIHFPSSISTSSSGSHSITWLSDSSLFVERSQVRLLFFTVAG